MALGGGLLPHEFLHLAAYLDAKPAAQVLIVVIRVWSCGSRPSCPRPLRDTVNSASDGSHSVFRLRTLRHRPNAQALPSSRCRGHSDWPSGTARRSRADPPCAHDSTGSPPTQRFAAQRALPHGESSPHHANPRPSASAARAHGARRQPVLRLLGGGSEQIDTRISVDALQKGCATS
jgi:hypothetical protein